MDDREASSAPPSTPRAASYADARPTYPDELVDALVAATGIGPGSRLLEVGCGPGTATLPLARLGCRITAVELGEGLAAEARRRLAAYPDVDVVTGSFESWPPGEHAFDLVYAATAWHWVDPDVRYRRAHDVLRPDGHLAFWRADHVRPAGGDPFFEEIQEVYDEIGEGLPEDHVFAAPGELPEADRRDRGQRAVRGDRRAPRRLGDDLRRRRVPGAAGHVLRPHRHGTGSA